MKVAVAGFDDDRGDQPALIKICLRLGHAFGKPRNWNANIGDQDSRPGLRAWIAQKLSWRACQSRLRSSGFVAHSNDRLPVSAAIWPNSSDCSTTLASLP